MDELALAMVKFSLIYNKIYEIKRESFSGDSGGGMALKIDGTWKIIGIVSAAIAKPVIVGKTQLKFVCDLDNYMVYTDVSKFNEWIYQVILET
jgi:secreted trypsin-like serine protease